MKDAMVDTMVLVYGTVGGGRKPSDKVKRWVNDSRGLLLRMELVRIATVTATELLPFVKPEHEAATASVLARCRREAFDSAAESVANKLIRKLRNDGARCPECWGLRDSGPCSGCGNRNSFGQNRNDIYIAATAATAEGVRTLYTYDGGILALAPHLPSLNICRPPSTYGALFDRIEASQPAPLPRVAVAREVGEVGGDAKPPDDHDDAG